MKRNVHSTFTVVGRGEFPFDMLRYDACWPKTGDDAGAMHYDNVTREGIREVRRVTLCSDGRGAPTFGRWSSFGWSVDPETIKTEYS